MKCVYGGNLQTVQILKEIPSLCLGVGTLFFFYYTYVSTYVKDKVPS